MTQIFVELGLICLTTGAGIVGLLLILDGVRGFRLRSGRACPRCRYDMQGVGSRTCPECGGTARTERALSPFRRSWLRVGTGVLAICIALSLLGVHWMAKERGWRAVTPNLVWIIAAGISSSDAPLRELGYVQGDFLFPPDPTVELRRWERSLFGFVLHRRTRSDDPATREAALHALEMISLDAKPPPDSYLRMLDRLASDPSPDVRRRALSKLAYTLDRPELDVRIRAVLDGTSQEGRDERFRAVIYCFVLDPSYRSRSSATLEPLDIEMLMEGLNSSSWEVVGIATSVANKFAQGDVRHAELSRRLLLTADDFADRSPGIAWRAIRASWGYAEDQDRPAVVATMMRIAPAIAEHEADALASELAVLPGLPAEARATLLASALASNDRSDLDAALHVCASLGDDAFRSLAPQVLAALDRRDTFVNPTVDVPHPGLRERVAALSGEPSDAEELQSSD